MDYSADDDYYKFDTVFDKELDSIISDVEIDEAQEWKPDLTADIDYILPAHFGIVADIQRWILDTSMKKQPAIALGAALSVMAMILGRELHCDGIKGNLMTINLAGSTEGKDHPFKCIKVLLEKIGLEKVIHAQTASGVALVDMLEETPSCIMLLDEMGHFLAGINGKNANQYSREIVPMITELYTSAAPGDFYMEKRKKNVNPRRIDEPNLCIYGLATEEQIINAIRKSDIADGSMPRFLILFGERHVLINEDAIDMDDKSPPQSLIDELKHLHSLYGNTGFSTTISRKITISDEYKRRKKQWVLDLNKEAIAKAKQGGDKAKFSPFIGRIAVGAIQMALLIDQCASVEVLDWCVDIRRKSAEVFEKKYSHTGYDNENERQFKMVEAVIKESGKKGVTLTHLTKATREIDSRVRKNIVKDLLESGLIFCKPMREDGSRQAKNFYFWKK